jgi:hypothetical protein
MNTLFQTEKPTSPIKKIAIAIVALGLLGLGVWAGMEMVLRLASGRS